MHAALAQPPLRLAVLISGTGRSLKNMLDRIDSGQLHAKVVLVISSTPTAHGLQFAEKAGIPIVVCERKNHASQTEYSREIFQHCHACRGDVVVLAGFIKRLTIPADFENRVVNIHPALVPSFSGKGFYGHHVHEAVLEYGVKITGCTVHFVDNEYDHGPVILQKAVPVMDRDTPDTLQSRVFAAECEAYPEALQLLAEKRVAVDGRRVRVAPPSDGSDAGSSP
ncbi:MAG: phosphoribosylglycinamide formyltransferase [Rhodopirellula sp.]|nr:phosphoribosylglycinamide formyltransferase [Rhodopirellula sp.]